MTISEEILIVANRLANSGKKPTVALVKTKLSQPVPLAQLINVLKNWQHQPEHVEFKSNNTTTSTKKEVIANDISQQIEKAIAPLYQEIEQLKKEIANLKINN
ncbi:MAG: hypothetical protein ACPG46_06900 [Thalassotalea sp.]